MAQKIPPFPGAYHDTASQALSALRPGFDNRYPHAGAIRVRDFATEGYERTLEFTLEPAASGLARPVTGYVAVHSTALGPSLGGMRFWPYEQPEEAFHNVLMLSEGMTFKSAVSGLLLGGGKMVVQASRDEKNPTMLASIAAVLDYLDGQYITAEDVGATTADMDFLAQYTAHVTGLPSALLGGDPSPFTAQGVYLSMLAAAKICLDVDSLAGRSVAIQGVGAVGGHLAALLAQAGAKLYLTDVNPDALHAMKARYPKATAIEPDEIHRLEVDIFAPCALAGVLNALTIPEIKAPLIIGGANNQLGNADLSDPDNDAVRLFRAGKIHIPGPVANAGGILSIAAAERPQHVRPDLRGPVPAVTIARALEAIGERTRHIIEASREEQKNTFAVVSEMVRQILAKE